MKSEKGITLMTLIIYMIVIILVISILSIVSNFFYKNTDYITENSKYISEYNKFNMYFIDDVKNNKEISEITQNRIVFQDGTVYTYKGDLENSIYRNKVKICTNISYCNFSKKEEIVNNVKKYIITVNMLIKGSELFDTVNDYVLRYW